jgi:hypothetical protein
VEAALFFELADLELAGEAQGLGGLAAREVVLEA